MTAHPHTRTKVCLPLNLAEISFHSFGYSFNFCILTANLITFQTQQRADVVKGLSLSLCVCVSNEFHAFISTPHHRPKTLGFSPTLTLRVEGEMGISYE